MKIRPVGAELFHVDRRKDGRTDTMKLIVAVRNFADAPKMMICVLSIAVYGWNSSVLLKTRNDAFIYGFLRDANTI